MVMDFLILNTIDLFAVIKLILIENKTVDRKIIRKNKGRASRYGYKRKHKCFKEINSE